MTIYKLNGDGIAPVAPTSFASAGIYERKDIQQHLLKNIKVIGDDLLVISEEFSEWSDSTRRVDLLCLDTKARLVVVEIKRTEDGGHMELQALRYAAMISTMTFEHVVEAYADAHDTDVEAAETAILSFLRWPEAKEEAFAKDVRIVLVAADFGKEVTTTVLWLRDRGIDVRCMRLKPYQLEDGPLLLDVQQLIPLPEAASFQTQLVVKRQAEREGLGDRHSERREWWSELAKLPGTEAHAHVRPKASPYHFVRNGGLQWAYLVWQDECGVELFIDLGGQRSMKLFEFLQGERAAIEERFGQGLSWLPVGDGSWAKVQLIMSGGYRSPHGEWKQILTAQVSAMQRLRAALEPFISDWRAHGG